MTEVMRCACCKMRLAVGTRALKTPGPRCWSQRSYSGFQWLARGGQRCVAGGGVIGTAGRRSVGMNGTWKIMLPKYADIWRLDWLEKHTRLYSQAGNIYICVPVVACNAQYLQLTPTHCPLSGAMTSRLLKDETRNGTRR